MVLIKVHQEICLHKDLIVHPVYIGIRMVVADQIADALDFFRFQAQFFQHNTGVCGAFLFLELSVAPAIFLFRRSDADIMHQSSALRDKLGMRIQVFHTANHLSKAMHFHQVLDTHGIMAVKQHHFFFQEIDLFHVSHKNILHRLRSSISITQPVEILCCGCHIKEKIVYCCKERGGPHEA